MKGRALLIGLFVVAAGAAVADNHENKSYARFGVVNLINTNARNATSENGFTFSYGRMLHQRSAFNASSVEIGWMRNGNRDKLDTFSLLWVEHYMPENSSFVFSAGGGLAYHDLKAAGVTNDTATRFALRLSVGYLINETTTVNFDYNLTGAISGLSTNRFGITAGVKF